MKGIINVAAVTASCAFFGVVPTRPSSMPAVSARQLLLEYWNRPKTADSMYKGETIEVAGLVQSVTTDPKERVSLKFDVNEMSYAVACRMARGGEADARRLSVGQLVAVRGTVTGASNDRPQLADCQVVWALEAEDPDENKKQSSLVAAASLALCVAEVDAASTLPFLGHTLRKHAAKLEREGRSRLAAMGATAIPCTHPSMPILKRCMPPFYRGVTPGPVNRECNLPSIAAVTNNAAAMVEMSHKPDPLPAAVQQLLDRYTHAKTYRDTGSVVRTFDWPDGSHRVRTEFKSLFVRPDKFRFQWTGGNGSGIVVSDGKRTFFYSAQGARVRCLFQNDLSNSLAAATTGSEGASDTIAGLFGLTRFTSLAPSLLEDVQSDRGEQSYVITGKDPVAGRLVKLHLDPNTGFLTEFDLLPDSTGTSDLESDLYQRRHAEAELADPRLPDKKRASIRNSLELLELYRKTVSTIEVHADIQVDEPIADTSFALPISDSSECESPSLGRFLEAGPE
jgi:outer membrane lipoprotein-sorting protein